MNNNSASIGFMKFLLKAVLGLIVLFTTLPLLAQENPPIPIRVEVRTARNLNFGSFVAGPTGGNVNVDYDGVRTSTGDIFLMNAGSTTVSSAIFDVFANPGTIVYIQDNGETTLTNANGNGSVIYLTVNNFSTGDRTFVTSAPSTDTANEVFVGGTLRIPSDNSGNLPGTYNGTFTLTFIHQ